MDKINSDIAAIILGFAGYFQWGRFFEAVFKNSRLLCYKTNLKLITKNNTNYLYKYILFGKLHNESGPAIIYEDGTKKWYYNSKLHNESGPARIDENGDKYWYIHGKLHNESGPAIIDEDGTKKWYYCGKLHNESGPAIIDEDGHKEWYYHGKRHRDGGLPAIEYPNGNKYWYNHGKIHNESGPAIIDSNVEYYFLNNFQYYSKNHYIEKLTSIIKNSKCKNKKK